MRIPYVIDNTSHRLADVLNELLRAHPVQAMDIATAYFTIRGYAHLQDAMQELASFRLLIGAEPETGSDVGMRLPAARFGRLLRQDLNQQGYSEATLQLVEDLIRYLRRESVAVRLYLGHPPEESGTSDFLHAKAYLLYGGQGAGRPLVDRINPIAGVVGSSNFTGPGLTRNHELNTLHKAVLDAADVIDEHARAEVAWQFASPPQGEIAGEDRRLIKSEVGARAIIDLTGWYNDQWALSRDFKQELIDILNESKFGEHEYTPYEVYLKALYEYFRDDLGGELPDTTRTAVELAEFQEDAVRRARRILAQYDGVMIADSVGLGKTWIGKRLLEEYAYHLRQKALVICPASLRSMWQNELRSATIAADVISQEELGREEFDIYPYADVDVVLIDESHNFRNKNTNRYQQLERLLSANGTRGRDGARKKIILLTATPINNNVYDLYHQINLFTGGDRSYFAAAGIGDLRRYFLAARQAATDYQATVELFNLLEEVVIRRTRPFIRDAYPKATIAGREITWPDRQLRTTGYDLEASYQGIYNQIVEHIEGLRLAHYNLEAYKRPEIQQDDLELGRQSALVGIFRTGLLKRFESSVEAFRISIRRALEFIKTFNEYLADGRLLDSANFKEALKYLERENDEDFSLPHSLAEELDAQAEAGRALEGLASLDISQYDLRALQSALGHDIDALTEIWIAIRDITPDKDAKLQRLKEVLSEELRGKKVLIFTHFRDTARYLGAQLAGETGAAFREAAGSPLIKRIDGGTAPADRDRVVQAFAPRAGLREDIAGTDDEIDILISTDVLSEGHNLQDAGVLLNYDLHWNPTRMIQRAGRIDRLGSEHDVLWVYNMIPEDSLEDLLGIVERLNEKIGTINEAGFLDASILGEMVSPRNFNTLRRIRDEDNAVIEEQEAFAELASSETLLRELQQQLATEQARETFSELPDGIHSGLQRGGKRGVFFYFTAPGRSEETRQHFWRYYDVRTGEVLDNRLLIANRIKCQPDTPRFIPTEVDIFDVQERVIESILASSQEQQALATAPKQIDPPQRTVVTLLTEHLNNPQIDRRELLQVIKGLGRPLPGVHVRTLRNAYEAYLADPDIEALVDAARPIAALSDPGGGNGAESPRAITREDLYLICFDYVWS